MCRQMAIETIVLLVFFISYLTVRGTPQQSVYSYTNGNFLHPYKIV